MIETHYCLLVFLMLKFCFSHVVIPMTSSGQTVQVTVGNALTLTVNITEFNRPLTEITWTEDGKMLINNTDNIIITHGSFAAPPTTSTLVRDPIQSPMNGGTYELTVMNPAGASMTTFNVTVNGKQISEKMRCRVSSLGTHWARYILCMYSMC